MKSNSPKKVVDPKPGNESDLGLQHLEALAGKKSEVIWAATLDGKKTYISHSVENILGWSVEEALSHGMFDYLVPESQAMVLRMIEKELDWIQHSKKSNKQEQTYLRSMKHMEMNQMQ